MSMGTRFCVVVKSARDEFLVPGRDPFPWIVVAER
ncbi:MAG: hypothetical protein JWN40_2651 [Phycisphaerales bacterium]|nr:hypothetical protein [Phycisphaerales bacterium]